MKPHLAGWGLLLSVIGVVSWWWQPAPGRDDDSRADDVQAHELAEASAASPGSLIVDFRDDVDQASLEGNGYLEEPISRFSAADRIYRVRFASTAETARALEALRRDPTVDSVDFDVQATLPPNETAALAPPGEMGAECAPPAGDAQPDHGAFPDDPCFRYQWHLRQIGMPEAWKLGHGHGAVVAVIDTGVTRVPDLEKTRFVPGYNFVADNDRSEDDHGHGTHVAGTIAQSTHNRLGVAGVAWRASIMPLKVLSASGSGSMAAISQAIRFAADNGAHVINMSLGGPFPVATIRKAVEYARAKGVTVVAAAGNDGKGRVSYPARYPGVIAVAATQFDEKTTFYSNWGHQIDVAAPGGNVRVDQNGDGKPDGVLQNTVVPGNTSRTDYLWFMGTSMASPHVAGVAALLVGAGVTDPDAVEKILVATARAPKASADGDKPARLNDRYGAGIVDAHGALKKVKLGRGAGALGIGGAAGLLALAGLRRRRIATVPLAGRFAAGLIRGACGLCFVPWLLPSSSAAVELTSVGVADAASWLLGGWGVGNPLIWSALPAVLLAGLFYGVPRARALVAGLTFGMAGALVFAAIAHLADVRLVPDVLDRTWLVLNAALTAAIGALMLRR